MCELIKKFSDLCISRGTSKEVDNDEADDDRATTNQTLLYSSSDHEDNNSSKSNAHDESASLEEKGESIETSFFVYQEKEINVSWKINCKAMFQMKYFPYI